MDPSAIGPSTGNAGFSYMVTSCTGRSSGDVPGQFCDTAGSFDAGTGPYPLTFDPTAPPLTVAPQVCGGFWDDPCDGGAPVTVDVGSAGTGDDPSLLAVFPNDAPSRTPTEITTST